MLGRAQVSRLKAGMVVRSYMNPVTILPVEKENICMLYLNFTGVYINVRLILSHNSHPRVIIDGRWTVQRILTGSHIATFPGPTPATRISCRLTFALHVTAGQRSIDGRPVTLALNYSYTAGETGILTVPTYRPFGFRDLPWAALFRLPSKATACHLACVRG